MSDSSGAIGCSNASQRANYLKISSDVSWPGMRVKPVRIESLVAPPPGTFNASQGNLVIRLTDQAGGPVSGAPIGLGSPSNATKTTEAEGCVVFGALTAGSYDVSYSLPGYVDPSGDNARHAHRAGRRLDHRYEGFQYAEAGTISVSFDTQVGSGLPQPSQAQTLSVVHSGIPGDARRLFSPTGGPYDTINATSLFPFTSGYGVYAGSCHEADPTLYSPTYYDSNPAS